MPFYALWTQVDRERFTVYGEEVARFERHVTKIGLITLGEPLIASDVLIYPVKSACKPDTALEAAWAPLSTWGFIDYALIEVGGVLAAATASFSHGVEPFERDPFYFPAYERRQLLFEGPVLGRPFATAFHHWGIGRPTNLSLRTLALHLDVPGDLEASRIVDTIKSQLPNCIAVWPGASSILLAFEALSSADRYRAQDAAQSAFEKDLLSDWAMFSIGPRSACRPYTDDLKQWLAARSKPAPRLARDYQAAARRKERTR